MVVAWADALTATRCIDRAFDAGSIFRRLQSNRIRNAEVCDGYI
jgi:hypothetical protein